MGADTSTAQQVTAPPLTPLSLPQRLAPTPGNAPKYAVTIRNRAGDSVTVADPRATRALVALMDVHAVNGGAACHWGGPAAFAEINAAHLDVHRSLVGLIGSQRLVDFADDLAGEIRLALARIDTVRGDADEQTDSHQTLIEMLERGDIEEAAHELEHHHLAVAEELMLDLLADP